MKIAFIIPSLRNLGPIIVVENIIHLLSKKNDIEITVFYFDHFESDILNFEVTCKKISFFKNYDFSGYDVIHTHGLRPDIYTFFNRSCKYHISTQHNIIFDEYIINNSYIKAKLIEKLWVLSLKNKNKVVAIGETARKYYQKFFVDKEKVLNIPNGRSICKSGNISEVDLRLIKSFKKDYICIGTCTRAIKLKGHKQIIQALVEMKNFCFILVGEGDYLDELKSLACELGVVDRCLFLGYRKNATDYLSQFDIFSQTSYTESISIALLEAAAAKKAIVCSDIPVNRDVFLENEVSFFIPDDIPSLISAIKNIALDISKYENNVFNKYQKEYTSEIMSERYYDLYKSIIYEF
ncbi:glycosyltransferase family 4 protein [Acinetobacter higginsii]|uniref:glycosyltransferase family 4 protein n=1 Tax=Acinetobacter higginsii TaxID=70347 RepID=UPI0026769AE4|nr:glycosyltransferase family 4 protein [Acinetobacter higginsii]MDO3666195.1 glycosyltransferase family 4 protein [Acinetobacter higginsii]